MEKRTLDFLENVSTLDFENISRMQVEYLSNEAHALLVDIMKEKVLEIYKLTLVWNVDLKEAILERDKVKFIHESYYKEDMKKFLNENLDKLNFILQVLKDYLESGENNG